MNAIITICAKNYIGLSRILGESIKKTNPDIDFYIFVADEFSDNEKKQYNLPDNVLISKDVLNIKKELWDRLAFQYDLTELCTAIKPFCLEWMFQSQKYNNIAYMDPDILVYDNLQYIWDRLKDKSVFLTPHITSLEENFSGQITEEGLLFSGMYNLGFIALRKTQNTMKLLAWWKNRLVDKCFVDIHNSLFYDQKWIDFLPCTLGDDVLIDRHLGCNMAPWNFYERKVFIEDGKFFIRSRNTEDKCFYPLLFVHYSGYNYKSLLNDVIEQKNINMSVNYTDVQLIIDFYKEYLINYKKLFMEFIQLSYSYSAFSDGVEIRPYQRRIYRSLISCDHIYQNPFDSKGNLYCDLKSHHMLDFSTSVRSNKIKTKDVSNVFGRQLYWINVISKIIFRIIGVKKYMQLMQLMKYYSRYESQIHLMSQKYMKDNLK